MDNNQNNSNEKNLNLINKLRARLKTAKIVKKIACLTLACGMTLATISCSSNKNSNSSNINSNGGTNSEQQSSSNTEDSKYSQILQNILSSEYYSWLLGKAKENNDLYDSAQFDPHPYAFLEDEGFDVDAIRNGEIACRTQSFVKETEPNNLYIATYVENKNGNYYTQYMLKYHLTDQEMQEYQSLHQNKNIYAIFYNNAISDNKECEIISEIKINIDTHKQLCSTYSNTHTSKPYGSPLSDIILKSFNESKNTFEAYFLPAPNSPNSMTLANAKFALADLRSTSLRVTNDVFMNPTNYNLVDVLDSLESGKIKYYNSQSINIEFNANKNFSLE